MIDNQGIIIGNGVVGKATAKALGIEHYFDFKGSNISLTEARDYKYIFICLPTPFENGRYKTDEIEAYIRQMTSNHVFVIRSTVYPGFGSHMAKKYNHMVVSYPEFLTESSADDDAVNPDIVVAGSDHKPAVDGLHDNFLYRLGGHHYYLKDNTTAEFVKLAINGFYSTKVLFANMMYDYANNSGVKWDTVKEIMYRRKWIGNNHLTVPFKNKRGLNGKCLPKDYKALSEYSGSYILKDLVKYNASIGGCDE